MNADQLYSPAIKLINLPLSYSSEFYSSLGNSFEVRELTLSAERIQGFQLRYSVYVEELGRDREKADHENRILSDSLDETCAMLGAFNGSQILGTSRMNYGFTTEDADQEIFDFQEQERIHGRDRILFVSKMMVESHRRSSIVFFELAKTLFLMGIERKCAAIFIGVNRALVRCFERLGFRCFRKVSYHPRYGEIIPMKLDCEDLEYLRDVKSLFYRAFLFYQRHTETMQSLSENPLAAEPASSRL